MWKVLEEVVWTRTMGACFSVSEVEIMTNSKSINISGLSKKELIQVLENLDATGTVYVCGSSNAYINQIGNNISFDEKSIEELA